MEQHAIHQSFVIIDLCAKVLQLKPTWLLFPSRKVPGCRTDRLFCQPDFGSHSPRWTDWSQAGLGHQTGGESLTQTVAFTDIWTFIEWNVQVVALMSAFIQQHSAIIFITIMIIMITNSLIFTQYYKILCIHSMHQYSQYQHYFRFKYFLFFPSPLDPNINLF